MKKLALLAVLLIFITTSCERAIVPPQTVEEPTAAERILQAQAEFDAGRLHESLTILQQTRPEQSDRNTPDWADMEDDFDSPENLENEFYRKDQLLTKLCRAFLSSKRSPMAVEAAKTIGLPSQRDRLLDEIVRAQIKAVRNPQSDVSAMFAKAISTASLIDSPYSADQTWYLIAEAKAYKGRSLEAIRLADRIVDVKRRDQLLIWIINFRGEGKTVDNPETILRTAAARLKTPSQQCLGWNRLAMLYDERNRWERKVLPPSPQKCREALGKFLEAFDLIAEPNIYDLENLIVAIDLFKSLDENTQAETLIKRTEELALKLKEPGERCSVYQKLLSYLYPHFRNYPTPMPPGYRERWIRLAFESASQIDSKHAAQRLVQLLNAQPSPKLYDEIVAALSSSPIVCQYKIDLGHHYLGFYNNEKLTEQERLDGFRKTLLPLLNDIYTNHVLKAEKGDSDARYANEHTRRMLGEVLEHLRKAGHMDVALSIVDSSELPEGLRQSSLVKWSGLRVSQSGIEDVTEIETRLIGRIVDPEQKAGVRNRLYQRFGGKGTDLLDWNDQADTILRISDPVKRFGITLDFLGSASLVDRDVSALVADLKKSARSDDESEMDVDLSIRLFGLATRRALIPAEENAKLLERIEQAIDRLPSTHAKFRKYWNLIGFLKGTTVFVDESVKRRHIEKLYEMAKAVPLSELGNRLNAFWLSAQRSLDNELPDLCRWIVDEALAYAETLPKKGRSPAQTLSPLRQIEKIKGQLPEDESVRN